MFHCEKCDRKYSSKRNLIRHLDTNLHKRGGKKSYDEKKKHMCTICDYKTITPYDLRRHMRTDRHSKNSKIKINMIRNGMKRAKKKKNYTKFNNLKLLLEKLICES